MASRFTILNFDFYSVTSWASNYDICNSIAIAFLQGYASTMEQQLSTGEVVGKKLSSEEVNLLSEQQLTQLLELHKETGKPLK